MRSTTAEQTERIGPSGTCPTVALACSLHRAIFWRLPTGPSARRIQTQPFVRNMPVLSETLQLGRIRFDVALRLWGKCMCTHGVLVTSRHGCPVNRYSNLEIKCILLTYAHARSFCPRLLKQQDSAPQPSDGDPGGSITQLKPASSPLT